MATPKTDAVTVTNLGRLIQRKDDASYVPADFARQLETQVQELREALGFYVGICGNTCAVVDRQSALEAYNMAQQVLDRTK